MSGGGGSSTNTIQSADPWKAIQPYLTNVAAGIQNIYQQGYPEFYPGQTYIDPNNYTQAYMSGLGDYAGSDALNQMIGSGMNTNQALLNPFTSPYSSAVTSLFPGMSQASTYGVDALYPSIWNSLDAMDMLYPSMNTANAGMSMLYPSMNAANAGMSMLYPSMGTAGSLMSGVDPAMAYGYQSMGLFNPMTQLTGDMSSMLYPSMGSSYSLMSGIDPSMQTALYLQGMGLNYDPGLYTPQTQIMQASNPSAYLDQMMATGGMNPYLNQMVGAAQQNALQNYGMTTQQAADAYETGILPQIQDARTLIQDALGSFTEEALPQITDQALATGTLNSTRTDLAEGTALSGIYDSLNRELSNLARTADITGANTYQDILRNQSNTLDDVNALAASMYGGAWDQSNQNILSAANIGAGMTSDWQNAMLQTSSMDLERQLANQNALSNWANMALQSADMLSGYGAQQASLWPGISSDIASLYGNLGAGSADLMGNLGANAANTWGSLGLDTSGLWGGLSTDLASQWGNLSTSQATGLQDLAGTLLGQNYDLYDSLYGNNLDASFQGLSMLPSIINLGTYPASLYQQIGSDLSAYEQAALQDDMDRYNYYANAPMDWTTNYANMMAMLGGLGGSSSSQSFTDTASNPWLGAAGGAMVGYTLGSSGMASALGMSNPYTAIGGALLGYLMSQ